MTEITREEFIKATKGHAGPNEIHDPYGVAIYWNISGKIYTEYHPDIGKIRWSVSG